MIWLSDEPAHPASYDSVPNAGTEFEGIGARPLIGTFPDGDGAAADQEAVGPQAFVIDTVAGGASLRVHYHVVDQFQYVAFGSGRVGGHEATPGVVHYSDRLVPYGPIVEGGDGLVYLTLRANVERSAWFMPESRIRLSDARSASPVSSRRRNIVIDLTAVGLDGRGTWRPAMVDFDGLVVAVRDLSDGEQATTPHTSAPGAYLVVVSGCVSADAAPRPAGSVAWAVDGSDRAVVTGVGATRLAWLQFPRRATPLRAETSDEPGVRGTHDVARA